MSCTGRCARSQSPDTSPADAGPINPPAHSGGGSDTRHPRRLLGLGLLAGGASEVLLPPPPRVQRGAAPCRGEYLPVGTPAATLTCLFPARALLRGGLSGTVEAGDTWQGSGSRAWAFASRPIPMSGRGDGGTSISWAWGHPGTPRIAWPCFGPQGQQSEVPPWPQPFGLAAAQKCQIQPRGKGVASEGHRGALAVRGVVSWGFLATSALSQPPQTQAAPAPWSKRGGSQAPRPLLGSSPRWQLKLRGSQQLPWSSP